MLYGINFIVLEFLKLSNIKDKRVKFKRRKTGKEYDIKISPSLDVFLKYYTKEKEREDFIFSVIKGESSFEQYRDSKYALASYNKKLKKIAKL